MKKRILIISKVVFSLLFVTHVHAQVGNIAATFTPAPVFDYNVTANNPDPNDGTDTHQLSGPVTQGGITMTSYNVGARQENNQGTAEYRYLNFGTNYNAVNKANSIELSSAADIRQVTLLFRGGGGNAAAQPIVFAGADESSAVQISSGTPGFIDGVAANQNLLAPGTYRSGNFPVGTKYVKIYRTGGQTLRVYRVLANSATFTLPLNFLSFNAKPDALGKSVNLNWKTTNEINTKEFIIEKRTETTAFTSIDKKPSNNTAGIHNYSYTDNNVSPGMAYYRLKQIDNDGVYEYSTVALADVKGNLSFEIFPNPTTHMLDVVHESGITAATIKVLSLSGKILIESAVSNGSTNTKINVSSLSSGTYVLLYDGINHQNTFKFIKH